MRSTSCLVLLGLLAGLQLPPAARGVSVSAEEPFIGWAGESYQPNAGKQQQQQQQQQQQPSAARKRWVEIISWHPRASVYHNFLTDEECTHMKRVAAPSMKRSTVVGANGDSVLDSYRTSYGTFVKRRADPVVTAIEARVAEWARIPEVHAEDFQVLRYGLGQQYKPHMDTLRDADAGPRVATVLLYFNDVELGGETAFPESAQWAHEDQPKRLGPFSNCTKGGVAFRPRKGDALMFWSINPDGKSEDMMSTHTGCPVLAGVKWTGTKWIHAQPFRAYNFNQTQPPDPDPGHCTDDEPRCKDWADSGECKKNAGFMVGDVGSVGKCRKSCGVCTPCKKGDLDCYNANREKLGYLVYDAKEMGEDLPGWDAAYPPTP